MRSFAYHRSLTPNLSILLALAVGETIVVHILVMAIWGWRVAIVLGLIDLSAVVFIVQLMRSLRRYPVTIGEGVLTMRLGTLKSIAIPLANIGGLRSNWDAAALKQPSVANLALATWPNVVVDLAMPIERRGKPLIAVAHKLDDPEGFASALNACMARS